MAASVKPTASRFDLHNVRNRIIDHITLKPSEIADHPGQAWDHPDLQARAIYGGLQEVGVVAPLMVYRSPRANNTWVSIDGHLRKSLDPDYPWPCDVLDVTDEEADYIMATFDPIGMLKQTNAAALDALLNTVSSGDAAIQQMLTDLAQKAGLYMEHAGEGDAPDVEFEEFDESAANEVKLVTCPKCGHQWPG